MDPWRSWRLDTYSLVLDDLRAGLSYRAVSRKRGVTVDSVSILARTLRIRAKQEQYSRTLKSRRATQRVNGGEGMKLLCRMLTAIRRGDLRPAADAGALLSAIRRATKRFNEDAKRQTQEVLCFDEPQDVRHCRSRDPLSLPSRVRGQEPHDGAAAGGPHQAVP